MSPRIPLSATDVGPAGSDIEALAVYLGQHPEAMSLSSEALAARFNLPPDLVAQMMTRVTRRTTVVRRPWRETLSHAWRRQYRRYLYLSVRATWRPHRFLLGASLAMLLLATMVPLVTPGSPQLIAMMIWLLAIEGLYSFCIFRQAQYQILGLPPYRLVAVATVSFSVTWLLAQFIIDSLTHEAFYIATDVRDILTVMSHLGFQSVLLLFMLAGGVVSRHSRIERRQQRRSRQELLLRLLRIKSLLKESPRDSAQVTFLTRRHILVAIRRHTLLVAAVTGFIYYCVSATVWHAIAVSPASMLEPLAFLLVWGILGMLAEHPLRGVLVGLLADATLYLPATLTHVLTGAGSWSDFVEPILPVLLLSPIPASLGGLLGLAEKQRAKAVRRRRGDAAELMAEMIDIQWRLALGPREVCVLVVDVAGSTVMKLHADPILAEVSFRSYQQFVASVAAEHEGKVHSTAGDGAVVAFPDCHSAMTAAQTLQTRIAEFNGTRNRLPRPFQMRIGLHVDEIAGSLDDVVFSRVIDVAAHVEATAPVGGIALTEPVAQRLLQAKLKDTPGVVDGYRIMIEHTENSESG